MKPNRIITLNLETQAKQLRNEGKSFEEIAKLLSDEANRISLKLQCSVIFKRMIKQQLKLLNVAIN